jgi:hypothetical protein
MDERMARKIGEVKAFTLLGIELFEKGKGALEDVIGQNVLEDTITKLTSQLQQIDEVIEKSEFAEAVNEKAAKTKAKVGAMADAYIGDAWDDPTELCEWLGFFEGAAIVHFSLVFGLSGKANLPVIQKLTDEGVLFHQSLLHKVTQAIKSL